MNGSASKREAATRLMPAPFHPGSRRVEPEIMDQPDLAVARHHQALRGLERVNFWSAASRSIWPALAALAKELSPRTLRVLDVGSGGGDLVRKLHRRAQHAGLPMAL